MANFVTNGEHDQMMRDQQRDLSSIAKSLRRANAIAACKALLDAGCITTEEFSSSMDDVLRMEGFERTPE